MRPLHDFKPVQFPAGATVNEFIESESIDMSNRVCVVDQIAVDSEAWDAPLPTNALVIIHPKVGASVVAIIIIAIVIAVALYFLIEIPKPIEYEGEDSAFSLRGQRNQAKFGQPVEKHYGQVTHFPSYLSKSYTQFVENDQFFHGLFCIGLGRYTINNVKIEETLIDDFSEAEWEIYQPGQLVTMFPTNVQTSPEVGGIQLFGSNEEEFLDWSGPFTICAADSKAYRIEIDFAFRQGLYKTKDSGLGSLSVSAEWQYRVLNADDTTGPWLPLLTVSKSAKDTSPLRYTAGADVPKGRYQVRGKRLNSKNTSYKYRDDLHWEALRAFCESEQNFGDVTILAVKARATNNLNDSSKNAFNVNVTSKLQVYDLETDSWSLQETRNPVWAAVDVLRAKYGMRLATRFIDLEKLSAMAEDLDSKGVFFDYTFDQRGTVWQALQTIFTRARAVPVASSGRIFAIRDAPLEFPTLGFSQENIIKESFSISSKLPQSTANDGLEVEYIEAETWKKKNVLCLFGSDKGNNPKQVSFAGCTNRQDAWRWGMYQRAVEVLQTDNISFETGLEGGTAVFGDLIAIRHELLPVPYDVLNSDAGRLSDGAFSVESGNTIIALPHAPTFEEFETHRIALRDKTGAIRGPFAALPHSDPKKVTLSVLLSEEDFEVSEGSENATYFFSVTGREYVLAKIAKIEPGSNEAQIKITAVPYNQSLYEYDDAEIPTSSDPLDIPSELAYPEVTGLTVNPIDLDPDSVLASWDVSPGARFYVVASSLDGASFSVIGYPVGASQVIDITPGPLWVRVYAVNVGAGPATVWNGTVGEALAYPDIVTGITLIESIAFEIGVSWAATADATSYTVKTYAGAFLISESITSQLNLTFDRDDLQELAEAAGHVGTADFAFTVEAFNSLGSGGESAPVSFDNLIVDDISTEGNVIFQTPGKGPKFKLGDDCRIGTANLVAGTVTVANITANANTHVLIQRKTAGGTLGNLTFTIDAGVGFTIDSSDVADTSEVFFMLVDSVP